LKHMQRQDLRVKDQMTLEHIKSFVKRKSPQKFGLQSCKKIKDASTAVRDENEQINYS
jgi:hypothetical protein